MCIRDRPRRYSFAEERIKAAAKKSMKRGKAEISIIVENVTEDDMTVLSLIHISSGGDGDQKEE